MISQHQIQISLAAISLILWSEIILIWLFNLRLRAVKELQQGEEIPSKNEFPAKTIKVADNYNHLMEQPVLFYALCLLIIVLNLESSLNTYLA